MFKLDLQAFMALETFLVLSTENLFALSIALNPKRSDSYSKVFQAWNMPGLHSVHLNAPKSFQRLETTGRH